MGCIRDFSRGEILAEIVIHMGMNPIGHNLHSLLHSCWVRRRKKLREISLEYFLYVFVLGMIVAHRICNEVDPIFPLPLSSFEMEKLGIFISML
jgi:hypothetical protein